MRLITPGIGLQPRTPPCSPAGLVQGIEVGLGLDPSPHSVNIPAFAKGPDPGKFQSEARRSNLCQLSIKISRHGLLDVSKKAQGYVKGFRWTPFRLGQARLSAEEPLSNGGRYGQGGE